MANAALAASKVDGRPAMKRQAPRVHKIVEPAASPLKSEIVFMIVLIFAPTGHEVLPTILSATNSPTMTARNAAAPRTVMFEEACVANRLNCSRLQIARLATQRASRPTGT